MKSILGLTTAVLLALVVLPTPSIADRGVGVTLGRIDVTEKVKPGGSYKLPAIGILNTGSEEEEYRLGLAFLTNRDERRPQDSWIDFSPATLRIGPGESRMVDVHLTIPSGAEPGDYFALLEASVGDDQTDSTLAGAATKLTFTVAPSSWLDAQVTRLNRWLDDASPWPEVLAGVALLAAALLWLSRRVRFRLPFEPR